MNLETLIKRLENSGRNILDTLVEVNFAASVITSLKHHIEIYYEPDIGLPRPPDFQIINNETTFWIQIKNPSRLAREDRQSKIMQEIQLALSNIPIKLLCSCEISDKMVIKQIPTFVEYIKNTVSSKDFRINKAYSYLSIEDPLVVVKFCYPAQKNEIEHLTLLTCSDLPNKGEYMIDVTGLDKKQIQDGLCNAAGAFSWEPNINTINLIAICIEQDHQCDALFEAVYGTEGLIVKEKDSYLFRKADGFFLKSEAKNVVGIIALQRQENSIITPYNLFLLMNESYEKYQSTITAFLPIRKICDGTEDITSFDD